MIMLLMLTINLEFVLGVKGHPVVTEGKEESPDDLDINVNAVPLLSFSNSF